MPRPEIPQTFEIPAGTPPAVCKYRRCRARIYWIITKNGKRMPVRAARDAYLRHRAETVTVPDACEPSELLPGRGWSHHIDCPAADAFRRRGR